MQYGQPPVLWGVMFSDGSVRHKWNGRTQLQRALEERDRCNKEYPNDNITIAFRESESAPWSRVTTF